MVDVRIKPLEWKEARFSDKYQRFTVVTPFGLYEVLEWSDGSFGGSVPSELREDPNVEFSSDTLERAKAAAQADYERRVRSTLSDAVAEREAEPVASARRVREGGKVDG
jgi:hypothetical protein